MPTRRSLLCLPILALVLVQAGCPTERMPPPKEAAQPEDEWSRIAPSKEWLYATGEFNGPHKAECDHVLGWVKGEDTCRGSLCVHGKDLAAEWIARCTPLVAAAIVTEVEGIQEKLAARAEEKETDCAKWLGDIVGKGCASGSTCLTIGQRWATHCAKAEGTPLTMRILQRTIERGMEQGSEAVQLDTRTCAELRADVMEAAKCKDRFVCADAVPRVNAYRDRCEKDAEPPGLATAVAELIVIAGGGKPADAILLGGTTMQAGEVPVMLDDKTGGVISVCEERATDLARYVASRKSCQGGQMMVARAFSTPRGNEVRVGSLDFPDDATFSARYPTIVAAGELDLRDKEASAALDAELGKAAALARSSAAEAGKLAAKVVLANLLSIRRSPAVRTTLAKYDEALVPALRELARAKIAATRGKVPAADVAGMLARGRTRAFADLSPDGTAQIGASSRGFTFDTAGVLPRAHEAHAMALKGARRTVDARTGRAEKARGVAAAQACGAALRRLTETKKALASCNFGLTSCDAAQHAKLLKTVDEARVAAENAFHDVESTRTGGAADAADDISRAAETAGCREPWW